jgi:hypothetical protein
MFARLAVGALACFALFGCASNGPIVPPQVTFDHAKFALWYADHARVQAVREADRIILRDVFKRACATDAPKLDAIDCARLKGSDKVNAQARKMDLATEITIRDAILNPASAPTNGFDMEKILSLLQRAGAAYLSGGTSEADDLAGLLSTFTK